MATGIPTLSNFAHRRVRKLLRCSERGCYSANPAETSTIASSTASQSSSSKATLTRLRLHLNGYAASAAR